MYSNPASAEMNPAANLKRPDSGNRHNTVITRKKKSFLNANFEVDAILLADLHEAVGRFFQDLGLMQDVRIHSFQFHFYNHIDLGHF